MESGTVETCIKALELHLASLRQEYERIVNLHNNSDVGSENACTRIKKEMSEIEEGIQLFEWI